MKDELDLLPSATFVLRTPLLPFDTLHAWSRELTAVDAAPSARAAALVRDRAVLRDRLRALLELPELRDALRIASPDLDDSIDVWREAPDSEPGLKVERALVRYLSRMATRPTPFGLFAGISTGVLAAQSRFELVPRARYERHSRLDNDYLFALGEALAAAPELRGVLRYRASSSSYNAAGRLCYAESRRIDRQRTYHLVAARGDEYLAAVLRRSETGATRHELARALLEHDAEIDPAEAEAFVDELVDAQLLVPELGPTVTGARPIVALAEQLASLPPAAATLAGLRRVDARLHELDAAGLGAPRAAYDEVAELLGGMPVAPRRASLLQVDLVKPCVHATLGENVVAEIERGIAMLVRMSPHVAPLRAFRDAFVARYEEREVPLAEAIDDEIGLGTELPGGGGEAAPLLQGLVLGARSRGNETPWNERERRLLGLLEQSWKSGAHDLVLTDRDIAALSVPEPCMLPDAFSTTVELAAASADALATGEFRVLIDGGGGPSGARMLGRFCQLSPEIHACVSDHLRAEEALRPDAVFAELAYLPEGKLGNVACRPVLRAHEIVYLGRSGAPIEQQLTLDDLTLCVRGDRLVLRSRRLGREVIPRCSTAHAFTTHGFGVYKFLCMMQAQDGGYFSFDWGPLGAASFLPRVSHGRLVLARARWTLAAAELAELSAAGSDRCAQFDAMQQLRERRALPRHIALVDGDNELVVDLDNALAVESFVHLVRRRHACVLHELFPPPDHEVVRGPEGGFRHQLTVCFVRAREPSRARPHAVVAARERRFAPGSSWLYAKLYTGHATADALLRDVIAPVAADASAQWFFVRYGDPSWHVRVRFNGERDRLQHEVAPRLHAAIDRALAEGLAWRAQLDTYERELERYGGPIGTTLAEQLFWRDSEAALDLLADLRGDDGMDARWRLALVGCDLLMEDLGLALADKHAIASRARDQLAAELSSGTATMRALAARFRSVRSELDALLDCGRGRAEGHPLAAGIARLQARSQANAAIVAELRTAERDGMLSRSIVDMAWSYLHMHVNRMLRSSHRAQELVVYDYLRRCYESRIACAKPRMRRSA